MMKDWPTQRGSWNQSLMYSITLKSILNKVQPIKGFVYESVKNSPSTARDH